MFVFSSHTRPANSETSPAALTTPALDRRSLRWFGISPARRPRRTYLHHWHSTDRADDLLHHHHFPSGHTWVPIIRSWALTRGFSLHPGTRNRYEIGTRGLSIGPHRGRSTTTAEFPAPTGSLAFSRGPSRSSPRPQTRRAHKRQLANRIIRRMWRDEIARQQPHTLAA